MESNQTGRRREAIELQPRDWEFLLGLFDSRVVTVAQAGEIYFEGRLAMAKKRVGKLKRAGLLLARPAPVGAPAVLYLSRAGLRLLADHDFIHAGDEASLGRLARRAYVSAQTLAHEVAVVGVVAAFHRVGRECGAFLVSGFWTRPRPFRAGGASALRPDAEMGLRGADSARAERVFIEVDNSTESLRVIRAKLAGYALRASPESVILFIVESSARKRNIERVARETTSLTAFRFYVVLRPDLTAETIVPILADGP